MSPGSILLQLKRLRTEGANSVYIRNYIAPKILRRPIVSNGSAIETPIHTLVSQNDWLLSLWMLSSLVHTTGRQWTVVIHEDGSLGQTELDAIATSVPGVEIVRRKTADREMAAALAGKPRCQDYRARMPHGLKCFDIPHFAKTPKFLLIDPDVLFFCEPTKLISWAEEDNDRSIWFNRDPQEPSPISKQSASEAFGIDLWDKVNSGLCLLNRDAIDYNEMETWLGHAELAQGNQWRVEQSLFALAASKQGDGGLLPDDYEVSLTKNAIHQKPISRHYVGAVRHRFFSEGIASLRKELL